MLLMSHNRPCLAVIPARGGSKRIPRKNIKSFAGKPMISYAISAARQTGLFDHVIVTTDDAEIAEIALSEGAEVPFMRPDNLADDHTPTVPVVAHAITACRDLGWLVEDVCCIYPGVPLIDPQDISHAYEIMQEGGGEHYIFPVTGFPSPIQRALRRDERGVVAPFYPEYASTRTQDLEPGYHDAGQFYWGPARKWLAGLNIHANGRTIVLPESRVVDIDVPEDWERAEALYRVHAGRGV
jgi:pseudaminic acid cytidylyltransferase